jgi:hypothetical protein
VWVCALAVVVVVVIMVVVVVFATMVMGHHKCSENKTKKTV